MEVYFTERVNFNSVAFRRTINRFQNAMVVKSICFYGKQVSI